MTATETPTAGRYIVGLGDHTHLIVPAGAAGVPADVRAASDAFAAAIDAVVIAGAECREARRVLQMTSRLDAEATEAAEEALEAAERRLALRTAERTNAIVHLARTVRDTREKWLPAAERQVAKTREQAVDLLLELGQALDRLAEDEAVLTGLQTWPSQGALGGSDIGFGHPSSRDAEAAEARRAEVARERRELPDRGARERRGTIPNNIDHLLGALRVLVGE